VQLSRKIVQNIHLEGGSLLGVSRGGARTVDIVDSIEVSVWVSVSKTGLVCAFSGQVLRTFKPKIEAKTIAIKKL